MTFPSDATPIFDAVKNALTQVTGQPRAIPSDRLFRYGTLADIIRGGAEAGRVFGEPRCFVIVRDATALDPQMLLTNRKRRDVTVEVRCWHYSGAELQTIEFEAAAARARSDAELVLEALSFPGALDTDPSGNETGLDGGCLRVDAERYRCLGPVPLAPQLPRVLQVTHIFRSSAEFLAAA